MTSTPAYDPNRFTTGIDPADVGEPRERPRDAAHEPRDPGPLRAGQHLQGDRRDRRARGRCHHAADDVLLPGLPLRLQHRLPLHVGRPRPRGPAARDPGVLQRLLLQRRGSPRDRRGSRSGPSCMGLGSPTGVDLPHEASGPHAQPRVEAAGAEDAVVRRRDGVGGDRAGAGERHAAADGPRRRLHRQRRAAGAAAPRRAGGRRAPLPPARVGAPGDDRRGHGGDARGGRGGDRLARAAPERRGLRQDRLGAGGGPLAAREDAHRARDPAPRLVHRASRPRTTPGSRSPCSSSTAAAAARRRRPVARRDPEPLLRARPRRASHGRRRGDATDTED